MRLLFKCFKYKSLQLMHYSALVYDLYALKQSHSKDYSFIILDAESDHQAHQIKFKLNSF